MKFKYNGEIEIELPPELEAIFKAMMQKLAIDISEAKGTENDIAPYDAGARVADDDDYPKAERCYNCWCDGCKNFEDCIVKTEGLDNEIELCPCDECRPDSIPYMPKDAPATCGKWEEA